MVFPTSCNVLQNRSPHLMPESVVDGILESVTYDGSMLRFLDGRRLALQP
jgi:hypothetical protein